MCYGHDVSDLSTRRHGRVELVSRLVSQEPGVYFGLERLVLRHDDVDGWDLVVTFARSGGIVGFEIRAPFDVDQRPDCLRTPEGGLTRRQLQAIPLGEIENAARSFARAILERDADDAVSMYVVRAKDGRIVGVGALRPDGGPGSELHERALKRVAAISPHRELRTGRPRTSDEDLVTVAAMFAALVDEGARNPYEQIAEALHYSPTTVATRVRTARRRGFLTKPTPTRSGSTRGGTPRGELTDKARKLLEEMENS
jgi:hypothetical protein